MYPWNTRGFFLILALFPHLGQENKPQSRQIHFIMMLIDQINALKGQIFALGVRWG